MMKEKGKERERKGERREGKEVEQSGLSWVIMGHRGRTQNHERRDITLYIAGI